MRLLIPFLHLLSTGFFLSFLSSSPASLLASATPIDPSGAQSGRTDADREAEKAQRAANLPRVGSLVYAAAGDLKYDTGSSPMSTYSIIGGDANKKCVVVVTEVIIPGERYKGFVFISEKAGWVGEQVISVDNFFQSQSLKYGELLGALKAMLIDGFKLYNGYGQVADENLRRYNENLLDSKTSSELINELGKLVTVPVVGSLIWADVSAFKQSDSGLFRFLRDTSITKGPNNVMTAMFVTQVRGTGKYKGIIFAKEPRKTLPKALLYSGGAAPLRQMLEQKLGTGFDIYAGYGQVKLESLHLKDGLVLMQEPLTAGTRKAFIALFSEQLKKLQRQSLLRW